MSGPQTDPAGPDASGVAPEISICPDLDRVPVATGMR